MDDGPAEDGPAEELDDGLAEELDDGPAEPAQVVIDDSTVVLRGFAALAFKVDPCLFDLDGVGCLAFFAFFFAPFSLSFFFCSLSTFLFCFSSCSFLFNKSKYSVMVSLFTNSILTLAVASPLRSVRYGCLSMNLLNHLYDIALLKATLSKTFDMRLTFDITSLSIDCT